MSYLVDVRREMSEDHVRDGMHEVDLALSTLDLRHLQTASMLKTVRDMVDDSNFDVDQLVAAIDATRALLSTAAESFDAVYSFCGAARKVVGVGK